MYSPIFIPSAIVQTVFVGVAVYLAVSNIIKSNRKEDYKVKEFMKKAGE